MSRRVPTMSHTMDSLERNEHPLTYEDMLDVALCLVWDGKIEGANRLVRLLVADHRGRDRHLFYKALGMREVLAAILGQREHRRNMRTIRARSRKVEAK